MQWRVTDALQLFESEAWENDKKQEESRLQFIANIATSINKTVSSGAEATSKTLANGIRALSQKR